MVLALLVLIVAVPLLLAGKSPGRSGEPLPLPRGAALLFVGLALHLIWLYGVSRLPHVSPWLWWLPVAADAPIAGFLLLNRRVTGLLMVFLGLCLNAAAMTANGGLMPVTLDHVPGPHVASRFDGGRIRLSLDRLVDANAPLAFLGDTMFLGRAGGIGFTLSVGDLIIAAGGVMTVLQVGMRRGRLVVARPGA